MGHHFEKHENRQSESRDRDASSAFQDEVHQHREKSGFKGLNLGIIKIGTESGSLALGVNVGIAKVDTKIGKETRVDAGVGVGPIGAKAGAGVGFDKHGIHADAGAKARVTDHIKAGTRFGANVGAQTGVEGEVDAKVGKLVQTKHEAASSISKHGFNNGYDGNVSLFGNRGEVKGGAHANLNRDSSVGANASARAFDKTLATGADLDTDRNSILRPGVHVSASDKHHDSRVDVGAQLGPTLDAQVGTGYSHVNYKRNTERAGALSFGVGENGVGFKATDERNGKQNVHRLGLGRDYRNEDW
ncbi:MAG: hypothetical protein K2X27_08065 [Candidatus Obscuribacterales bacterium]|nr:hypothetical protein [Candidatus Obscuribacterales bacterium]